MDTGCDVLDVRNDWHIATHTNVSAITPPKDISLLLWEGWHEPVPMELLDIVFTYQLDYYAGLFSHWSFLQCLGLRIVTCPLYVGRFCKFILNKLVCKFDKTENSLSSSYVKYMLIVPDDIDDGRMFDREHYPTIKYTGPVTFAVQHRDRYDFQTL